MKFIFAIWILAVATAPGAAACGGDTLAIVKSLKPSVPPPAFGCGQAFNEMLQLAQRSDWSGALAAYEEHLKGLGRQDVGTPDAEATLAFLRDKSERR